MADCKVYFSPNDQVADRLIELIDEEKHNIKLAVYCLTHGGIADALVRAKARGVSIEAIVDPFSLRYRTSVMKLVNAKIPLYVWNSEQVGAKSRALMHDKFCVFSDRMTWTGSFNFTNVANRIHQENVVVIENPSIASRYSAQFAQIKLYGCMPYQEWIARHPPKQKKKQ